MHVATENKSAASYFQYTGTVKTESIEIHMDSRVKIRAVFI